MKTLLKAKGYSEDEANERVNKLAAVVKKNTQHQTTKPTDFKSEFKKLKREYD